MSTLQRNEIMEMLWSRPIEVGHWLGFNDLTDIHNEWLRSFLYADEDQTLQGHRGSYKTTVLSLFFPLHILVRPNETVIYLRKTSSDVMEIARQSKRILESGCFKRMAKALYGIDLQITKATGNEINTNLCTTNKGASQILGLGIGTSITGKHADIIVTDDIVNVNDRISAAEREKTKIAYQELQNIKNRGGRFINTGTPWHKDDAFSLMPNLKRYDCYSTGLMTDADIAYLKENMSPSLFAANYELKHIASEDVIFANPQTGADIRYIYGGLAHLDSAFYGEDYTAFTIMSFHDGKYYVLGKMWRKHVENCYADILSLFQDHGCSKLYNENNADKGLVARDLKNAGARTVSYAETMNKYIKIVTYLKGIWKDVIFVEGTDDEYIEQICDYNENAEHDDAPDSCSCLARLLWKNTHHRVENKYQSLMYM